MNSHALTHATLNRASIQSLNRNRRYLTPKQVYRLDSTLIRMQSHPRSFDRPGSDYAQRSGIILMSDWDRAHKFTHCSFHGRNCLLWKFCNHCAYLRQRRMVEKFLPLYHLSQWHFLTLSFTGHLLFGPESLDDITDYWNACQGAIRSLEREYVISGAICVEELSIRSLKNGFVLPHCHFLVSADEISNEILDELDERIQNHPCTVPRLESSKVDPNPEAEIHLTVSSHNRKIESEEAFGRVLRYLVKPLDIVTPYESAIRNLDQTDLEDRIHLNQMTDQFLHGHSIYTENRHQISYIGNLDTRTGDRCLLRAVHA